MYVTTRLQPRRLLSCTIRVNPIQLTPSCHVLPPPCPQTPGPSSPSLSPFLPPFCHQLLSVSGTQWTSTCLDLMATLQLTPAVTAAAWQVLLGAAAQLQGHAFLTGMV